MSPGSFLLGLTMWLINLQCKWQIPNSIAKASTSEREIQSALPISEHAWKWWYAHLLTRLAAGETWSRAPERREGSGFSPDTRGCTPSSKQRSARGWRARTFFRFTRGSFVFSSLLINIYTEVKESQPWLQEDFPEFHRRVGFVIAFSLY